MTTACLCLLLVRQPSALQQEGAGWVAWLLEHPGVQPGSREGMHVDCELHGGLQCTNLPS